MRAILSLRRLSESCPGLFRGAVSLKTPFVEFAARLAAELRYLDETGADRIGFSGLLPLDFFLLFPAERRGKLLSGGIAGADWRHAAAVRLTELLAGERFPGSPECFGRALESWRKRTGLVPGNGMFRWAAAALEGKTEDLRELTETSCFNGAGLTCFLGRGSTSAVYGGELRGVRCAVKVPVSGQAARFLNDLKYSKMFSGEPFFPEVYGFSDGEEPWSMISRCRTGRELRLAGKEKGFAAALGALHRRNLLHGDVRPANLGTDEAGRPVLLDFSHVSVPAPEERAARFAEERRQLYDILNKGEERHERDLLSVHVSGAGETVA